MLDAKQVQAVFDIIRPQQDWNGGDEGFCRAVAEKVVRALQAVGPEPAVAVKPLEWHKSRMPSWNDDWHTTAPIIYTVRCADENGWKWSFHGGQGYERSPEAAKAAAQADYASRIRSALVATPPAEPVVEALRSEAGTAYCRFIDKMSAPLCLGVEHKLETGKFGAAELNAHVDARELYGFHRGINHALAALAAKPAVKDDETVVGAISGKQVDAALEKLEEIRNLKLTRSVMLQVLQAALAAKDGRS